MKWLMGFLVIVILGCPSLDVKDPEKPDLMLMPQTVFLHNDSSYHVAYEVRMESGKVVYEGVVGPYGIGTDHVLRMELKPLVYNVCIKRLKFDDEFRCFVQDLAEALKGIQEGHNVVWHFWWEPGE